MTLPMFIYDSFTQPGQPPESATQRAWGAALVLIVIVMVAQPAWPALVGRLFAPKTGR